MLSCTTGGATVEVAAAVMVAVVAAAVMVAVAAAAMAAAVP